MKRFRPGFDSSDIQYFLPQMGTFMAIETGLRKAPQYLLLSALLVVLHSEEDPENLQHLIKQAFLRWQP